MSFKRNTVLVLVLMLCLSAQLTHAQSDDVTRLATQLDQQASANGLPLGDGNISVVEQTLASAVVDEVNTFSDAITSFEQSSPENAAFVETAEARVTQYEQARTAATGNNDTLVQLYMDTVAQYDPDLLPQQAANGDIQSQVTADSVAQYNSDIAEIQSAEPMDPKVQAVIDQVNDYLAQDAAQNVDPKVQAVNDAVKDYLAESDAASEASASELQNPMVQMTIDAINEYLDNSNQPRKKLVKQHIDRQIRDAVPRPRVDLMSGIYSYGPNENARSGDCSNYTGGDADGPGEGAYNPEDPTFQAHVCFAYPYGLATVDGDIFRAFGATMPNLYQTSTSVMGDGNSMYKTMNVISDSSFEITTYYQEGTCTVSSTVRYDLYVPGAPFGCNPNSKVWNVGDDQVDVKTGEEIEEPEDIEEPEEVIIDPIIAGEYSVLWMPFSDQCDADYIPTFDTVTLNPTSFDTVEITAFGETFQFGSGGMDEGLSGRFDMLADNYSGMIERRLPTDFNFTWLAMSDDNSQSCSARGLLTLGTAADEQPVFDPPFAGADAGPIVDMDAIEDVPTVAIESGSYDVTWTTIPGLECPAELEAELPNFAQATLEVNGSDGVLSTEDREYALMGIEGGYYFAEFGADNSGMNISLAGAAPGQIAGSYTLFSPDGDMCLMTLTLDQQ
jgi:hypothetical protein